MASICHYVERISSCGYFWILTVEPVNAMTSLNYRHVLCIVLGVLIVPVYVAACILSIFKAHRDRKAIKARNEARRLAQPVPASSSNPVDIIANEVRANRWHRRHSSITSAKVQTLLNVINNQNKPEDERSNFCYTENLEERKKRALGDLPPQSSRDNLLPAEQQERSKGTPGYVNEKEDRGMDKNFHDSPHRFALEALSSRDKDKRKDYKQYGDLEVQAVEKGTKLSLDPKSGIDNPAVHLKDESPYCYDSSEEWVRTSSGALEMVNMRNKDPSKNHHQLQSHCETSENGQQRYIFHPARSSREDLTNLSLSGKMHAAKLARFDSYDSSEFPFSHDFRGSKQTSRPHQKPPRQHQHPEHRQQQHQHRQQRSRRDLDDEYDLIHHEKRRRHDHKSYPYNEEIDLSPRKLLPSVPGRDDSKYLSQFSKERPFASHRDRKREIDMWLGAGRRNSYASALDRNEVDLYLATSRSLSVADLSSSKKVSNSRNGRLHNDPHSTKQNGRINNAFSKSMEQNSFDEF